MFDNSIQDLLQQYVAFIGPVGNSWNKTYCEDCGDGSRTKGPRGGFRFDGDKCAYHCFNCGIKGTFDPDREYPFSKDMKQIFDSFGLPEKEYYAVAYKKRFLEEGGNKFSVPEKKKFEIHTMEVPDFFYKLSDASDENVIAKKALEELAYRNVDPNSQVFYLSNGRTKGGPKSEAVAKALMNRLIIPFFDKDGNMIYYQGRALDRNEEIKSKMKYLNADVPRSNIVYGMDRLSLNGDSPLYFTEGYFDAYHLKGVSIQENALTEGQIELLRKSPRRKVFVPDKKSDSTKVIDQCAKLGWSIAVPDIGSSCKDIDDAIRKYGKLYTLNQVASNIYGAHDAKIFLSLNGFINK